MRCLAAWVPVCFILLLAGCGARKHPFQGRVEFDDGTPLAAGFVVLESEDGLHSGVGYLRGLDGRFEMSWDGDGDGVPPGRYHVGINPPPMYGYTKEQLMAAPGPDWGLKNKYMVTAKSGLEVEVGGPVEEYVIRLDKSAPLDQRRLDEWRRQQMSNPE